jgi:hypothetical protein
MSPDFLTSLFESRKRYFIRGEPREIGKEKIAYFVAKFPKSKIYSEYTMVGEGCVEEVHRLSPSDSDYSFASANDWNFVIEFQTLTRYSKDILGRQILSEVIMRKLSGQRPFGVELSREESA